MIRSGREDDFGTYPISLHILSTHIKEADEEDAPDHVCYRLQVFRITSNGELGLFERSKSLARYPEDLHSIPDRELEYGPGVGKLAMVDQMRSLFSLLKSLRESGELVAESGRDGGRGR